MSFTDPPNKDEVIEALKNAPTHKDVVDIIKTTFPDWIMGWPNQYCVDYPHLKNNWEYMCQKIKCDPLCVIIVREVAPGLTEGEAPEIGNMHLIRMFTELLTIFGHSVRRCTEFVSCPLCGDAIPVKPIYDEFKARKIDCPGIWSGRCSTC